MAELIQVNAAVWAFYIARRCWRIYRARRTDEMGTTAWLRRVDR